MTYFEESEVRRYFEELLKIDSTTGQYQEIAAWVAEEARGMGYEPFQTHKGGRIIEPGRGGRPPRCDRASG